MPYSNYWENKLIRDPLYGFVGLSPVEEKLLNTKAMQRLTRIKQLSHTYVVYPSAVHTRLEHSLGTLHIASRISDQLSLRKEDKQAVRAAALLHDVGHGPFSHLFEEVMRHVNGNDFSHEQVTKLVIEDDAEVKRALGESLRKKVLEVFDGNSLLSEIVSSSLDADKMDYLRRDSYHTGVAYGVFDLERVLHSVCKIHSSDRDYVGIMEKGMDCLESYRLARYSMHTQVYEHHTRLVADDMFVKATNMSIDHAGISKEDLDISNPERFLRGYYELDDNSIEEKVMADTKGTCGRMMRDVRERRLLKRAYVLPLTKEAVPNVLNREKIISMDRQTISDSEKKIAEEVGEEPDRVIVHLQSIKIKLYERFEQTIGKSDRPILILTRTGSVTSFDEVSPISASLNPIRRLYVFAPTRKVDAVRGVAEAMFGAKSRF